MKNALLICVAVIISCVAADSLLLAEGGPYVNGRFQGRIALSHDGNFNDEDDWGAFPVVIALLDACGVKDKLVHVDFNNIIQDNDPRFEKEMTASVHGAAERYGIPAAVLHNCRTDLEKAVENIRDAVNASSAESPLYYLLAGPMDVPYRGILAADPAKRRHVYCLSHSFWNDGFGKRRIEGRTKRDVIALGIRWIQVEPGNRLQYSGVPGSKSTPEQWALFQWMRDSRDQRLPWIYSRLEALGRCDVSDATITYSLLTGDEQCDPTKLAAVLDRKRKPKPVAFRRTIRLEAENFAALENYSPVYADRKLSQRVLVRLTQSKGAIRTGFHEIYAPTSGRYDVSIRYHDQAKDTATFTLRTNGRQQGPSWKASAGDGAWKTHVVKDVPLVLGEEIAVEAEAEGGAAGELDYVQLDYRGPDDPAATPGQIIVDPAHPHFPDVGPAAAPRRPHAWQRWEHVLTSTRQYPNPYADVTLRVRYTGPEGRTLRGYGFWDGGDTFRIRCALPAPGTWQWETECSDAANAGLHRQRGTVDVSTYRGDSPLYRRGFLKVSDNRRYLSYGDAAPFLWIGDTAWAAPMRASEAEWEAYIADRAAKRFTVIQVAPAPQWAGECDRQGEKAFTDKTCKRWNPVYWQAFERKIQRANEAGLVVLLVGLMEPVDRYPESSAACLFARNIVARLFGNFVILSPSFDSKFMPLADEVGLAARDATAVHLITQHPGTPSKEPVPTWSVQYYDRPYLDFAGVQTGHNGGNRQRCAHHAIEWNLHLYRREPHKPVINLEAMYDGHGENAWQAVDARSLAWRSWLSGAMGYTYGAGDLPPKCPNGSGALWWWVTDPEKHDYWKKALQWESAFQMRHLHDFLAAIEWWRLEPRHELIRNQPEDVTRRMVLAKATGRDLAVAYLPDNDAIEVDLSVFSAAVTARWFDPVRGRYTSLPGRIENKGVGRFAPPAKGDWVLLMERKPY